MGSVQLIEMERSVTATSESVGAAGRNAGDAHEKLLLLLLLLPSR